LDIGRFGSKEWNPLGDFIREGAKVVIKPNWVLHKNKSGAGLECCITHHTFVEAVLDYVLLCRPSSVVVGDAPVQGCDFEALSEACQVGNLGRKAALVGVPFTLSDFRRTVHIEGKVRSEQHTNRLPLEDFLLFDLSKDSLLDGLTNQEGFRVTMYDPALLARTHHAGRHQYLVARALMEADVVLNLPKLKCHKKAGVTGALKNVVGINGNKEYLPHHRKGGSERGGDCYEGSSLLKQVAEDLLDLANRPESKRRRQLFEIAYLLTSLSRYLGSDLNLEGAWHGNDTVWRTCLDLNRLLLYGCLDGQLSDQRQRVVVSITDAIVGGDKDGPLAPSPVESRFVSAAVNPCAAEWVNATLMGFDPRRISLVRESFGKFRFPLVDFEPHQMVVRLNGMEARVSDINKALSSFPRFEAPVGWRGYCESDYSQAETC
jgi:uncharacterized protein (DUF362 family)